MPTYSYQCKKCGHLIDAFRTIAKRDEYTESCEDCGHPDVKRIQCQGAQFNFVDGGHKGEYTAHGPRGRRK